jgi:hypothetical protein
MNNINGHIHHGVPVPTPAAEAAACPADVPAALADNILPPSTIELNID